MLLILTGILKFIGLFILAILGVVLLLILIVLFVPLRYKADGHISKEKIDVKLNASYLLHIISFWFVFLKEIDYFLKVFGIKFNLKNRKKKVKKQKIDTNKKQDIDSSKTENSKTENLVDTVQVSEEKYEADNDTEDNAETDVTTESKENEDTKVKTEVDIKEKNTSNNGIKFYLEILCADETKEAFKTCKYRIGKAIKSILPRKGKIYICFGSGDAGLMGEMLGYYQALYPFIGHVISFVPVFTEKYYEVDVRFKGRIYPIGILYHVIRILLDRNCRRLIKLFIKKK